MGHREIDASHSLEECTDPSRAIVSEESRVLMELKLASGTGCRKCALTSNDCYNCVYQGVIHGAIAAIMIIGPEPVIDKMTSWMKMEGIQIEAKGEALSSQEIEHLRQLTLDWFARRVSWGDEGVSGLVPAFNRLDRWTEAFGRGVKLPDWL